MSKKISPVPKGYRTATNEIAEPAKSLSDPLVLAEDREEGMAA